MCQHGWMVQTAQSISLNLSIPNAACRHELHPSANEQLSLGHIATLQIAAETTFRLPQLQMRHLTEIIMAMTFCGIFSQTAARTRYALVSIKMNIRARFGIQLKGNLLVSAV